MMKTSLITKGLGKRFYKRWVFRELDLELLSGDRLLVTGSNGSGKSTLMRILAGQLSPTKGDVKLIKGKRAIPYEEFYRFISWSGPYTELYPDLTLREAIDLHFSFKRCLVKTSDLPALLRLEREEQKQLRNFSSGMLHRLKIGLAIFSQSEILMLDEATANMDAENASYIYELAGQYQQERILIYASNNSAEFGLFEKRLDLDNEKVSGRKKG